MKGKQRERVEKGTSERKGSLLRRRILHVRERGGAGGGGGGGGGGAGRADRMEEAKLHRLTLGLICGFTQSAAMVTLRGGGHWKGGVRGGE